MLSYPLSSLGTTKDWNSGMIDVRVFGESAAELLRVFTTMDYEDDDDGGFYYEREVTPEDSALFTRAMMRAEAKLLLSDADAFEPYSACRTSSQRQDEVFDHVISNAFRAVEAALHSLAA